MLTDVFAHYLCIRSASEFRRILPPTSTIRSTRMLHSCAQKESPRSGIPAAILRLVKYSVDVGATGLEPVTSRM
jgi:hypothetical protein